MNGFERRKEGQVFYELGFRERICLAATMGVALLLLSGYRYWGGAEHEHLSLGFMALLFLHLVLNRRYRVEAHVAERIKNAFVLAVSLCLVSGVLLSRYDLPFFPNVPYAELIANVHFASACWCILLSGAHVGLQMKAHMPVCPTWLIFPGRILVYAFSIYGVVVLGTTPFVIYMVAGSSFGSEDGSLGIGIFFLNRVALFVLAAWAAQRLAQQRDKQHA